MSCDKVSATLTLPTNYKGEHMNVLIKADREDNIEDWFGIYLAGGLIPYLRKAQGFRSILKGIPVIKGTSYNMDRAIWFVSLMYKCKPSSVYVKYRGKRTRNPNHTLKKDAHSFDVYVRNHV